MKKIIFLFTSCFLLFAFCLKAQDQIQFPDSSFETAWKDKIGEDGPYKEFQTQYFYTLNSLSSIAPPLGPGEITVERVGNAYHGQYCIKLTSAKVPIGTPIFLPGMVGTISENFVQQFLDYNTVDVMRDWFGNATPHALEGWYKYVPVNGDSALIDIGFSNDLFGGEDVAEQLIIKESTGPLAWKHFRVVIPEKYRDGMYANIRTLFVASAGVNWDEFDACKGQYGSTLWIDDIYLNYNYPENGIKQDLFPTLKTKAYPNPATDVLNLGLSEYFTGKIMIYNSLGSLVMEENINGTQSQLNTSTLATGNYIYNLTDGNTISAQGKFVVK
jgi:hypothetical protein